MTGIEEGDAGLVWRRPVMNGKLEARVRARGDGPVIVSVQSAAFPADEVATGQAPVESLSLEATDLESDRQILGVEEAAAGEVDLTQSEYIVAVGRGVGDADKIGPLEDLAKALGAELGASRPVIDNGWLPRERQVGSSGQTVAPKLYLAAGISGAIQHLVGMKGAQVIVAINKDRGAPSSTWPTTALSGICTKSCRRSRQRCARQRATNHSASKPESHEVRWRQPRSS